MLSYMKIIRYIILIAVGIATLLAFIKSLGKNKNVTYTTNKEEWEEVPFIIED